MTPKSDKGGVEDDSVKRREFIQGLGLASVPFIPPSKTTPFHEPSFVEELTRRSIYARHQLGGNSLVPALVRQAEKIRSASTGGGRELHSVASDFMRQGSWILRQAGRPDLAIQFANDAVRLAGRAGEPDKQALAFSALGYVSFDPENHSKNAGQAVQYARRGLEIPGIGDEPRVFLTGILAWSLANVPGQERQVRTEVDRVLNVDVLSAIDRADIMGVAGNALRDTGERRNALKMLEEAIDLSSSHSPYHSGRYLGDQIMIVLSMRDPERAAFLMNTLSYIAPLVDSAVLDRKVEQILQTAKPWSGVREIREARERLHAVRPTNGEPE